MLQKPDYIDIDNDGNTTEPMKKAAKEKREPAFLGGLKEKLRGMKEYDVNPDRRGGILGILDMLDENRDQYVLGGLARILSKSTIKKLKNLKAKANKMDKDGEIKNPKDAIKFQDESINVYEQLIDEGLSEDEAVKAIQDALGMKVGAEEGGSMSMDDQMLMVMTAPKNSEMESDDDMEDNYTRFIMDEALTEEEEDMLMSKLEQDEELAMIFDKVIDVAQEFAGSGPVEGPGSGVSDSIPARLSDGEFVFTAKATEQIGADELMRMMKEAEAAADERQGFAEGEMVEQEPQSLLGSGVMQEDEIAEDELKKRMVQGSSDYVRS